MLYRDSDISERQSILLDFFLWRVPASPFEPLAWYLAILLGGRETQIENFAAFIRREKRRVRQDLAGLGARGLVERLRIEPPLHCLCPSPSLLDPDAPPLRPWFIVPGECMLPPPPSQGQMIVEDLYYATDQAYACFGEQRQRPECYVSLPVLSDNQAIAHYAKLAHVFVCLFHRSPLLADTWMHTTPSPPCQRRVWDGIKINPAYHQPPYTAPVKVFGSEHEVVFRQPLCLPDAFSLDSEGKPNRAYLVLDPNPDPAIVQIALENVARKIPCEVY